MSLPAMRTDIHNHVLPRTAIELFARDPTYRVEISGRMWRGGHHPPFVIEDAFVEPDAKLEQLEERGLEAAVVSVIPPLFYTDLGLEPLARLCNAVNEGLAAFQDAHPDRFRWLAHVPIGFPEQAAEALGSSVAAGAVGVEIPTRVGPRRLDEPEFDSFWRAVEELGVPVLMHPFDNQAHPALDDWYLQNVIGNQLETTIAAERVGAGNSGAFEWAWLAFGRRGQRGRVSDRAGSVRACCAVVVVLVAAAIPGVARSPASLGAGEGNRDSSSSPSADGA